MSDVEYGDDVVHASRSSRKHNRDSSLHSPLLHPHQHQQSDFETDAEHQPDTPPPGASARGTDKRPVPMQQQSREAKETILAMPSLASPQGYLSDSTDMTSRRPWTAARQDHHRVLNGGGGLTAIAGAMSGDEYERDPAEESYSQFKMIRRGLQHLQAKDRDLLKRKKRAKKVQPVGSRTVTSHAICNAFRLTDLVAWFQRQNTRVKQYADVIYAQQVMLRVRLPWSATVFKERKTLCRTSG